MANNRYLIHYFLALCIGLLPVLNAGAMSVMHAAPQPMGCADCAPVDMDHDSPCQDQNCISMGQSCQSNAGAGYIPASIAIAAIPIKPCEVRDRAAIHRPRHLANSIYRPPIA